MKALEIWTQVDSPEGRRELFNIVSNLRSMSYEELKNQSLEQYEIKSAGPKRKDISIYRNVLDDGVIEIIIQMHISAKNLFIIKFAQVTAEGFRITPSGEKQDVPDEVIYGYM